MHVFKALAARRGVTRARLAGNCEWRLSAAGRLREQWTSRHPTRFDMQCPPETLKMTPVSLYNCASTKVPEKEGF